MPTSLYPATFATHTCSSGLSVLAFSSHPVTVAFLAVRVQAVPTLFRHTPPPVPISPRYVFSSNLNFTETELDYRSEEQRVLVRRSLQTSPRVDSPTSSEFQIIRQMVRTSLPPSQVSSLTPLLPVIAVASYLDFLGSTNSGKFNSSGRAFPDMSAQSENFIIAWDGEFGTVDGTSCSTPFFAGMVALINNELINGGGAPLGFLNPLIYSATDAFTDITSGDNPGCNTNGFSATDSWDPVRKFTVFESVELFTDATLFYCPSIGHRCWFSNLLCPTRRRQQWLVRVHSKLYFGLFEQGSRTIPFCCYDTFFLGQSTVRGISSFIVYVVEQLNENYECDETSSGFLSCVRSWIHEMHASERQ